MEALIHYIYGAVVIVGGLIALIRTSSFISFIMALLAGSAFVFAGSNISVPKKRFFGYRVGLVVAGLLFFIMGYRFYLSGKFMPAGMVASSSFFISIFDVIRLNQL